MKKFLIKPIIATLAITLFACSGEGTASSPENETSETESSSSGNKSSSSDKGSSSSENSKSNSSDSQGKSSSSGKSASGSSSSTTSSNSTASSSSGFSYTIENDGMYLNLKSMKLVDLRDGQTYDVELRSDSTLHMIQPLNYETPDSRCYNNLPENCKRYGRLYTWLDVTQTKNFSCIATEKICPQGWTISPDGTKGYYGGYFEHGENYRGIGKVQLYWGTHPLSTMVVDKNCDENIEYKKFCKDTSDCNFDSYYWYTDALYVHCYYPQKMKIPDSIKIQTTYTVPDYAIADITKEYSGEYGEIIDERDGNIYKTVEIGTQTWMAENLRYAIDSSWCYDRNCNENEYLGRYYRWEQAIGQSKYPSKDSLQWPIQGVCPKDWHIPTFEEWETLFSYILEQTNGQFISKAIMTTQSWGSVKQAGYNTFGFNLMPSGYLYHYYSSGILGGKSYGGAAANVMLMIADRSDSTVYVEPPREESEPYYYKASSSTRDYPNIRCVLGKGN